MKIRAVLFDMDGVLIDAQQIHRSAFREVLSQRGIRLTAVKETALEGLPTRVKLARLSVEADLAKMMLAEKQRLTHNAARKYPPDPERVALLAALRGRGVWTGVVTNSIRSTTTAFLDRAGFLSGTGFDDCIVTNEDADPKPSPAGYLRAMKNLAVEPSETVIFEDSPVGLEAARASGARVFPTTFALLPDHIRFLLECL
jgi:beta-phosphoglucomutase